MCSGKEVNGHYDDCIAGALAMAINSIFEGCSVYFTCLKETASGLVLAA